MKEGWEYKKLGEVCKIYQPQTIASSLLKEDGKYPVFGANGMIGRYDSYNHEDPEVLLCCRGATCGAINVSLPFSWINGNAMVVKPINDSFLKSFLRYILLTLDYSHIITGAAQPQITRTSLSPVTVPVPTIIAQQSIVDYLDSTFAKIDAMKANAEKALNEAKALFQASLKEMLEPKEGWEEKELKELTSEIGDGLHGTPKYSENGNYYFVNGNNFENGLIEIKDNTKRIGFEEYEKYKIDLNSSTVLLSINGTIGKTAFYYGEPIILGKSACYINVLPTLLKEYLRYFLLSELFTNYVNRNARQATIVNLGLKEIRNMPLFVPPLSEQQSIVATLDSLKSKVDRLKANYDKISQECDALKQAILRQVFE